MPDHHCHDLETLIATLPLGFAAWCIVGSPLCWLFLAGLVGGSLWLSPDLDQGKNATPARRWWVLRFIWRGYGAFVAYATWCHRTWISHWPALGTATRVLWLTLWVSPVLCGLMIAGVLSGDDLSWFYWSHEYEAWAVVAGLEAASLLHISLDAVW